MAAQSGMLPVSITVDGRKASGGTLEQGTDMIEVTALIQSQPDLAWEFVDPAGHFHAWTKDGKLPTLDKRVEHVECTLEPDDDPDEDECSGYDRTFYVCRICAFEVKPNTINDPSRRYIPGRSWWTVVVEGLDNLEYSKMVSVVMTVGDGAAKYFGIARVGTTGGMGAVDGPWVPMATLTGAGELGRKK